MAQLLDSQSRRVILPGNAGKFPNYAYDNVLVDGMNGYYYGAIYGVGTITSIPQSEIDLVIPSHQRQVLLADRPFVVPQGATVINAGLRLPSNDNGTEGVTTVPGKLEAGVTLVGTTGENLKLVDTGGGHTSGSASVPSLTSASNAYTPGDRAVLARTHGQADQASPNLLMTLAGDTTYKIYISNNGDTAAGNGISCSAGTGSIIAWVVFQVDADPPTLEQIGQFSLT